jgi:Zn-dependent protease
MGVDLVELIKWYLVFLFSTSAHEAAHAWAADRLGDDTGARQGLVALNPQPHLMRSPVGMVLVPLLTFILGGWMIGWASTPYDPSWAKRHPRRAALMSAAGPAANLAIVLAAAFAMRLGTEWGALRIGSGGLGSLVVAREPDGLGAFLARMLSLSFSLNLLLGAFNLLPVPPLDGSALPLAVLPTGAARTYRDFLRQPVLAWGGLMLAWRVFDSIQGPLFRSAIGALHRVLS